MVLALRHQLCKWCTAPIGICGNSFFEFRCLFASVFLLARSDTCMCVKQLLNNDVLHFMHDDGVSSTVSFWNCHCHLAKSMVDIFNKVFRTCIFCRLKLRLNWHVWLVVGNSNAKLDH